MIYQRRTCDRLTDVPFRDEDVVVDLGFMPIPGLFFGSAESAKNMQAPVRLLCPKESKLIQLDIDLKPAMYRYYRSGRNASGQSMYAKSTAENVSASFNRNAKILEIGAGRGDLIGTLHSCGFRSLHVMDPSDAVVPQSFASVIKAEFPPDDSPWPYKFDLIISEHFLEHSPNPVRVLKGMLENLSEDGEIWLEVPDVQASALHAGGQSLSMIYALHSSYFDFESLARTAEVAGAKITRIASVEHYGRSIVARLRHADPKGTLSESHLPQESNDHVSADMTLAAIRQYFTDLKAIGRTIPEGTSCYGAAERCMCVLSGLMAGGFSPGRIYDSNEELHGLFPSCFTAPVDKLAGERSRLSGLVILGVGYAREIVEQNMEYLLEDADIWIPGRGVFSTVDVLEMRC